MSGRLQARKPEVMSVSSVRVMRDSTTDNGDIAHLRGPRTV
ncbi:hypothetical protein ACFWB2_33675 [Streptomyces virginiae]